MKLHLSAACPLLVAFWILNASGMAQDSESASDSPQLPDLPSVERSSEPASPDLDSSRSTPDTSNLPQSRQRRAITQEQIDQANKEKNWLLEGLKENEAKAEAARETQETERKSIIDQVLDNNRQRMGVEEPENQDATETNNQNTFQPALSTTAFEPLPQIDGDDSLEEAQNKIEDSRQKQKRTWKAIDEKTGVPNVFFNPRTGTFETEPIGFANDQNTMEVEWQRQQRLRSENASKMPGNQNNDVEDQVLAFESRLIQEAKAQNKIPESFSPNTFREDMTFNPGRLDTNNSPYLFANQNNPQAGLSTGNDGSPFQKNQPSFTARQGNDAALAKLRMVEEERQRQFEQEQKPTILEIHTPRPTRSLEINPRFD